MGFSQGLSGLNAAAKALDVVGNNIANSQTYGFKAGSIAFADVFAGVDGLGVQVAGVSQNFGQGSLDTTGGILDMGINNGRGFFRMVNSDGGVFYGRNGQFDTDEEGFIVNKTNGLFLTGYQATGTPPTIEPGAGVGPIRIPQNGMTPQASSKGSLIGNLKADDDKVAETPFNPENEKSFNYQSQVEAYDSLGNKHSVKIYYAKDANGDWKAYANDSTAPKLGGTPPEPVFSELGLTFDSSGNMTGTTNLVIEGVSFNGAEPLKFDLDMSGMTKHSTDFKVQLESSDGYAPGTFQGYSVSDGGEITVKYSNGQTQVLAQVVMADFANEGGLASKGGNVWEETAQSGQPFLGTSGSGSFGSIKGGMLESSNVELGQEMVNMIVYQRNYQSNSQTIKTQSELLQTLVNLR
ncbi:flagellar hook protein FlgE [Enterobacter sp. CC120223-11]|uniref:flagellar hook protein FlgE n=1 Tax=Enterobacter sp. CC120223-11 TaxID=1378073 RepID=UPI000BCCEE53|nr:flagellar hook protein FlgE [Enterobacter sp. CC120223-11]SNY67731.1 flagellar hook protein FlgE [Enterobacter sp. CC120223-11]